MMRKSEDLLDLLTVAHTGNGRNLAVARFIFNSVVE